MARDWHETFKAWAKPPTETEEEKGSRAARMINEAIRASAAFGRSSVDIYPTGSYRNNTNVRQDSDVDVAVVLNDACFYELPPGGLLTAQMLGLTDASRVLDQFRSDVGAALTAKFGAKGVTPGKVTFDVHETSARLDADATPFLLHRRYTGQRKGDGTWAYVLGVETRRRDGSGRRIINWHQDHYDQGIARNDATRRRFKRVTRILKRLRGDMETQGTTEARAAAAPIPSFLIECLVFNAADACFNCVEGSYYEDVKATVNSLWSATQNDAGCANFHEVNRRKKLFADGQAWTRSHANAYLTAAWRHVGF